MTEQTTPETTEIGVSPAELKYRVALQIAWVAGIFSVLTCVLLLADYARRRSDDAMDPAKDPVVSANFKELKSRLTEDPGNEALRGEIRALDVKLRDEYFRRRQFAERGAWLLLGGVLVLIVAVKSATVFRRKLPAPPPATAPRDLDTPMTRTAGWAVAGLAVVLIGSAVALRAGFHSELASVVPTDAGEPSVGTSSTSSEAADAAAVAEEDDYPTEEEIARNWPRFRGPGGLGISAYTNVPTSWDAESGENIAWKTAVPLPGNNSPVVWGDRVFLSGADEEHREVYCFNTADGELLWRKEVPGTMVSTAEVPEVMDDTGLAASTMVTDGRRAYAIFANGDVAALDFDGELVWSRSLGIPKNVYGHGSSLAIIRDRLLIQFDQGDPKDGLSELLALDGRTGETIWSTPREKIANSWPTPTVINHEGRQQIITCADPWVIAYDPKDGSEIWRVNCLRMDVGPSPVYAGGVLYAVNESPQLTAIRPDGQGDVTETHILWVGEDGLPDCASPLATEERVYVLASYGYLTCYDAVSGEMLWEWESDDASFTSSPSLVGSLVYVFGIEGRSWVFELGEDGGKVDDDGMLTDENIVGTGQLGEDCVTSPAFQDGRIYIRGKEHLFSIGEK